MSGKRSRKSGGRTAVLDARSRKKARNRTDDRRAVLTITNGCFTGLEIPLKKEKTSLGSAVSCDICLDDAFVSEEHAIIKKSNGVYSIEDLNSRHGTSVNGKEVHNRPLKSGDRIAIGAFELRFNC